MMDVIICSRILLTWDLIFKICPGTFLCLEYLFPSTDLHKGQGVFQKKSKLQLISTTEAEAYLGVLYVLR